MKAAIIVIIIAALAVVGIVVVRNQNDKTEQTPATSQNAPQASEEIAEQESHTEPAGETNAVSIEDFAFKPASITVKKGTKVTWTNKDTARHTVTPDEASDAFKGSELLDQGQSYSFTFDTVGTYTYHCQPHPNMKGTVTVTE